MCHLAVQYDMTRINRIYRMLCFLDKAPYECVFGFHTHMRARVCHEVRPKTEFIRGC